MLGKNEPQVTLTLKQLQEFYRIAWKDGSHAKLVANAFASVPNDGALVALCRILTKDK